jgi:hypothetical protein
MDHPPPLLAVKGEGAVFRLPAAAIVGARNASLAGIKMARTLAAELGRVGYGIVSGLARGIDTAAHQGSIASGTIGVLAGGLDLEPTDFSATPPPRNHPPHGPASRPGFHGAFGARPGRTAGAACGRECVADFWGNREMVSAQGFEPWTY